MGLEQNNLTKISRQILLFSYLVKLKIAQKEEVHNNLAILQSQIASARGWFYMPTKNQGIAKSIFYKVR